MWSCNFMVFSITIATILANEESFEVVFVVSGADEFGGHPSKIYEDPILRTLGEIAFQFSAMGNTQYGLIWTSPGKTPPWEVVTHLASIQIFLDDIQFFFPQVESGILSTEVGLHGVLEFSMAKVFSQETKSTQILIVLVHQEVLGFEVNKFLEGSGCKNRVIVSVIVFPWKEKDCLSAESQLQYFNRRLNSYGMFKGDLGICSKDEAALGSISQVIHNNIAVHEQIQKVCIKVLSVTTKKSKLKFYGFSTTALAPVEDSCIWLFCDPWYTVGAVTVGLMLLCAISLPIYQVHRSRKQARQIRQTQLRLQPQTSNGRTVSQPQTLGVVPMERQNSVAPPAYSPVEVLDQSTLREQFLSSLKKDEEQASSTKGSQGDLLGVERFRRNSVSGSHSPNLPSTPKKNSSADFKEVSIVRKTISTPTEPTAEEELNAVESVVV